MPGETTYREKTIAESSPLNRTVPGYATQDAIALLYEAAVRKTFEELEVEWHWNDDPQALVVRLAENCFHSGIPQEEVTRRTLTRFYKLNDAMLLREMIKNVYQECKGFNRKDCLTKEQRLNLQMEEFMERRYEFRHNTQIGEVEYRERVSFRFNFSAIDKRAQNSHARCPIRRDRSVGQGYRPLSAFEPGTCLQSFGGIYVQPAPLGRKRPHSGTGKQSALQKSLLGNAFPPLVSEYGGSLAWNRSETR